MLHGLLNHSSDFSHLVVDFYCDQLC